MEDVVDHSLDGESRSTEIIAILTAGCVLTTAVVSLRIFTRSVLLRTFGVDDAFIIAAQVLNIGTTVAIGLGTFGKQTFLSTCSYTYQAAEVRWGLGKHTWVQPPEYYVPYMKVRFPLLAHLLLVADHACAHSGFLQLHCHIQRCHVSRQDLDPPPIPTYLRRRPDAAVDYLRRGPYRRVGSHDFLPPHPDLRPRRGVLGHISRGQMPQLASCLVRHGELQPHDRRVALRHAAARDPLAAAAQEAKVYPDGNLWPGPTVSNLPMPRWAVPRYCHCQDRN